MTILATMSKYDMYHKALQVYYNTTKGGTGSKTLLTKTQSLNEQDFFIRAMYRVAQNKIPHLRICNISATNGLILKILEAA